MSDLLCERQIFYTRDKRVWEEHSYLIPFVYCWSFQGFSGETAVYCKNKAEFYELLFYWNRSDSRYKFSPKTDQYGYIPVVATEEEINNGILSR